MEWLKKLWTFLSDANNREVLYFIGAGIWGLLKLQSHFFKKQDSGPTQVVNVGLTEEKFAALLKQRDEEIRKEVSTSAPGSEQRALLEKELAALEQKRAHLEDSLKATQKVYADTVQLLEEKLAAQLPPDRIEQAKIAITKGDPALAESLLNEVVASGIEQAAEASYILGRLAKDRVDYETAWKALSRAAELVPDNSLYLNKAGIIAYTLSRYDSAIGYYEKALAIDLETHGPDHPDVAAHLNNLGIAWDDKYEYDKAIGYYEKALACNLKIFGPEHPEVAKIWNNLGEGWRNKGEVDKAIEYMEKALDIDLKVLGPDHPQLAIYWNNLGDAWRSKGEVDKAIEYLGKALASDRKNFGDEHPKVAIRWSNLGSAWLDKGEVDKAIEYYDKALASDLKIFGPEHPKVAIRWGNLGSAWQEKGENSKAREYYEKALGVFQQAGLEHDVRVVEENIRTLPPTE